MVFILKHKRKRRLTAQEIEKVRKWMETSPMDKKPTLRQIARAFGVTKPSVLKSLEGWKGIERGRPEPPPRSIFHSPLEQEKKAILENYTVDIPKDFKP